MYPVKRNEQQRRDTAHLERKTHEWTPLTVFFVAFYEMLIRLKKVYTTLNQATGMYLVSHGHICPLLSSHLSFVRCSTVSFCNSSGFLFSFDPLICWSDANNENAGRNALWWFSKYGLHVHPRRSFTYDSLRFYEWRETVNGGSVTILSNVI